MTDLKALSQKTIFQSKYFHIDQIVVERNGKQFSKDVIERAPVVFILALTEKDEIYLLSQYRDAFGKRLLEVVAGTMDTADASPLDVAKRELAEETGLTANKWQELTTLHLSANMVAPMHIFLAQELTEGKAHQDDDEDIELLKMPFSEAVNKAINGEIIVASHIGIILLLNQLKQEGKI